MAIPLVALGALAGGQAISSGLGSYFQAEAAKDAARAQQRAVQAGIDEQRQAYKDVSPYYDPYIEGGATAQNILMSGIESGAFDTPQMGQFDYSGDVQQFLDPSMQYQQQQAQRALEESASAGGALRSGATMRALQNQAQDYAMQDYGNAFNRMTQDKNFAYQQFMNEFANKAQGVQNRYNQLQQISGAGLSAAGGKANLRTGNANNITNLQGQMGNARAAQAMATPVPGILNAVAQGASTFGGGMYQNQMGMQSQQSQYQPMDYGPQANQAQQTMMGFNPSLFRQTGGNI